MTQVFIGCVVEGPGEVLAVPTLVRRIVQRIDPAIVPIVPRPYIVKRNRTGAGFGDLERAVLTIRQQLPEPAGILVLFDADDDCPARLGPATLAHLATTSPHIKIGVVLTKCEYENWFLAAAESLRGFKGLPGDLASPPRPESIRDAKGWLSDRLPRGRKHSPTTDQTPLTAVFDLDLAFGRSDSFNKCVREVERLVRAILSAVPDGEVSDNAS